MIGNENNPANQMYLGVLAVGFVGSAIGRFRPRAMAHALFATAAAQALVGLIALVGRMAGAPVLDAMFVAAWTGSALLFRRAAGNATRRSPGFAKA